MNVEAMRIKAARAARHEHEQVRVGRGGFDPSWRAVPQALRDEKTNRVMRIFEAAGLLDDASVESRGPVVWVLESLGAGWEVTDHSTLAPPCQQYRGVELEPVLDLLEQAWHVLDEQDIGGGAYTAWDDIGDFLRTHGRLT